MKRLVLSFVLVAALVGFSVFGSVTVKKKGGEISEMLDGAISAAEKGDMAAAKAASRCASQNGRPETPTYAKEETPREARCSAAQFATETASSRTLPLRATCGEASMNTRGTLGNRRRK